MTKEELKKLVADKIAGQGTQGLGQCSSNHLERVD